VGLREKSLRGLVMLYRESREFQGKVGFLLGYSRGIEELFCVSHRKYSINCSSLICVSATTEVLRVNMPL